MAKTAKTPETDQTPAKPAETEGSPQKKKGGNTSTYNPEIARIICEQLSEGIPLRQICRENEGFPAWRTVYDWMGKDEELAASIARARDIGYDALAEECLAIADQPKLGEEVSESVDDKGVRTITIKKIDMLGHRKLQIETRLKLLAKFNPKKYGEKVQVGNDPDNPVDFGASMFGELLKNVELKLQAKQEE